MIRLFLVIALLALETIGYAQKRPKIVVGIVVDQMRYDFLIRYNSHYSQNGFNRLINEGFSASNMHYNYCPTYTGPGHSSIYTGSVPAIHGIVGNYWYEDHQKNMYCAEDESVNTVGVEGKVGKMSPKNLKTTTICDELKLSTIGRSKVIGVCIKDRGSILPAGHMANAAYWYDGKTGTFVSSTYYMKELPKWLKEFNKQKHPIKLMSQGWNTLLPMEKYIFSGTDDNNWEDKLCKSGHNGCCGGKDGVKLSCNTFPYTFENEEMNDAIKVTPYGNTLTTLLAKEVLEKEKMGMGTETDFLCVSYSSTDYIGHAFGPYSKESEDTYIRLDKEIEDLLNTLDAKYGKGNYLTFLTADHGVQDVPAFSVSNKVHGGNVDEKDLKKQFSELLATKLGAGEWVKFVFNEQIYLNKELLASKNISPKMITDILNGQPKEKLEGIRGFYSFENLFLENLPASVKEIINNGYYPHRSGDIYIMLEPNWMSHGKQGTTHGSPYTHDTHVPFIIMGNGIKPKKSSRPYRIIDIAPTLANLLGTLHPNGCIGNPIEEVEIEK
jgi:predicted AlkP superfamily pyrophosphatase or phosphodiesterase